MAYFRIDDERIDRLVEYLLREQMPDGGWNCQQIYGATHSSFHTTINVLEGLHEYLSCVGAKNGDAQRSSQRGREFFLRHHLYRSHRTGEVSKSVFTRFSFPPRWHHDVLRALEHFQMVNAEYDERLDDPINILRKKQRRDGRWPLQNTHPGRVHFVMEQPGQPSRWNTLRALRVLQWWKKVSA